MQYYFYYPSLLSLSSNSCFPAPYPSLSLPVPLKTSETPKSPVVFSTTFIQAEQTICSGQRTLLSEVLSPSKCEKAFLDNQKDEQDEQYNPEQEPQKRGKKSKQLQNRNVVPNIVRLILSYIQKPGKSSKFVEKLLQRSNSGRVSLKRFFLYQKQIKSRMNNYVHEGTLSQLVQPMTQDFQFYDREEQNCYRAITRQLTLHFLNYEAINCILTSKRMEASKKREHVAAVRRIIHRLRDNFRSLDSQ